MLTINNINANGEIFRKLLNSVADKYECGVHFNKLDDEMEFEGDRPHAKTQGGGFGEKEPRDAVNVRGSGQGRNPSRESGRGTPAVRPVSVSKGMRIR